MLSLRSKWHTRIDMLPRCAASETKAPFVSEPCVLSAPLSLNCPFNFISSEPLKCVTFPHNWCYSDAVGWIGVPLPFNVDFFSVPLLSPQLSFASFGGTFKTKATREKWTLAVLFSVLFSGAPLLHVFVLKLRILIFIIFSECVWSSRFTPGLAQYSCQLICLLQSLSPAPFLHKVTYTLHSLKGTPYTSALWALKRSKHSFEALHFSNAFHHSNTRSVCFTNKRRIFSLLAPSGASPPRLEHALLLLTLTRNQSLSFYFPPFHFLN